MPKGPHINNSATLVKAIKDRIESHNAETKSNAKQHDSQMSRLNKKADRS